MSCNFFFFLGWGACIFSVGMPSGCVHVHVPGTHVFHVLISACRCVFVMYLCMCLHACFLSMCVFVHPFIFPSY